MGQKMNFSPVHSGVLTRFTEGPKSAISCRSHRAAGPEAIGKEQTPMRPFPLDFTWFFLEQWFDAPRDIPFLDITPWKHDI